MERFRKYLGRDLNLENAGKLAGEEAYGVTCTYLPDPVEDFDEFEFRTVSGGREYIVITVAVEMGKIKRMVFGLADPDNPDLVRSMSGPQLEQFMAARGEELVNFFDYLSLQA